MIRNGKKGLLPIIECKEAIPCNPCHNACPFGAIRIEGEITNIPKLNLTLCRGCKKCVAVCPGQAIYMIDDDFSDREGRITFPYEFHPLPLKDTIVMGVNALGEDICPVKILEVEDKVIYQKTPLVTVAVPKEYLREVRFIKLPGGEY